MKQATFYLLDPTDTLPDLACVLITARYRQGDTLYVHAADGAEAALLDEQLWQQDTASFVPHALSDEPTVGMAPVEIGHQGPRRARGVLINLAESVPAFAGRFTEVIDFVPTDETRKQLARERYKQYRAAGFTLQTLPPLRRSRRPPRSAESETR